MNQGGEVVGEGEEGREEGESVEKRRGEGQRISYRK
jgi:hypothetical protein